MALSFTQSGSTVRVRAPESRNIAPPGQYMLFVFDDTGVPSVAEIVQLGGTAQPAGQAVQTGRLTLSQVQAGRWVAVAFQQQFGRTPVVAVGAPSSRDGQPVMARVRKVTTSGFEIRLDEWDNLDGRHGLETVSYVAAEPGRHRLGDVTLEAGALTADGSWRNARFGDPFGTTPVVLPQVTSSYDLHATNVRLREVNAAGFQLRLQEHEARERAGHRHAQETVHYIALSRGRGSIAGTPDRRRSDAGGRHGSLAWRRVRSHAGGTAPDRGRPDNWRPGSRDGPLQHVDVNWREGADAGGAVT